MHREISGGWFPANLTPQDTAWGVTAVIRKAHQVAATTFFLLFKPSYTSTLDPDLSLALYCLLHFLWCAVEGVCRPGFVKEAFQLVSVTFRYLISPQRRSIALLLPVHVQAIFPPILATLAMEGTSWRCCDLRIRTARSR